MPRPLVAAVALLATFFPALAGPGEGRSRFSELARAYREVEGGRRWEEVRARRNLLTAISGLESPDAVPLLYEAFSRDQVPSCRVAAMLGLGRTGTFPVLRAVATLAARDPSEVYRLLLPRALGGTRDQRIGPWLAMSLLPDAEDHALRAALVETLGRLRCPEALAPIRVLLASDEHDLRTRGEALLALGRIGGEAAFDEIAGYLTHPHRTIRQAAVLAVGETAHPAAGESVLPLAADDAPEVREAVAETLRRTRCPLGFEALIEMLSAGPLRVREAARATLVSLSGVHLGPDPQAWKAWREGRVPPESAVPPPLTYHGLPVVTDRALFLLDTSASMLAGFPSRMDTARRELRRLLRSLDRRTVFNVAAVGAAPRWWRDEEESAAPDAVRSAIAFAEELPVQGGANLYDTLTEAFALNRRADTIFIVTDGCPSFGLRTDDEEILASVAALNRFRRVHIHCAVLLHGEFSGAAFSPAGILFRRDLLAARALDANEAERFYSRLAAENGGRFVRIDR